MTQTNTDSNPGTIAFGSWKGGSGTSTVAAATALKLSEQGSTVLLIDNGRQSSLAAILGLSEPDIGEAVPVNSRVDLMRVQAVGDIPQESQDHDVIVIDTQFPAEVGADKLFLVMRNCYLSARLHVGSKMKWDGLVINHETDRPLTPNDIQMVVGTPVVAVVKVSAEIARATDAGIMPSRLADGKLSGFDELSHLATSVKGGK